MLRAAIFRFSLVVCLAGALPVAAPAVPAQERAAILQARYAEQMQAGKYAEALETIVALRRLQPNSVAAAEREGMTCIALERWIDAVIAFRRAIKLGSRDPVVRRTQAEALCVVAGERLAAGDVEGAGRLWVEAAETAPGYASTPYNRGLAYLQTGRDLEQAVAALSEAVDLAPDWPDPLFHRARAHEALGRTEQAVADYRAALKLAPDWTECREALLRAHTSTGDFAGAAACCEGQITDAETAADTAAWYGYRAGVYLQLGRYQEALNDLSAAVPLSSDVQAAHLLAARAVARFHLEDEKYAKEDFADAAARLAGAEVPAADRADGLAAIAWRMLEIGWVSDGLEVAGRAVAALETEAALRSLAALLVDAGRGPEAVAAAQKLTQIAPPGGPAQAIAAAAMALAGDATAAVPRLRDGAAAAQAAKGWSEDLAWLWYFVGIGYRAAGDEANAVKATERAYELMPRLKAARER